MIRATPGHRRRQCPSRGLLRVCENRLWNRKNGSSAALEKTAGLCSRLPGVLVTLKASFLNSLWIPESGSGQVAHFLGFTQQLIHYTLQSPVYSYSPLLILTSSMLLCFYLHVQFQTNRYNRSPHHSWRLRMWQITVFTIIYESKSTE